MAGRKPIKREFVWRILEAVPDAGLDAVNRAWRSAGHDGRIGQTAYQIAKRMAPKGYDARAAANGEAAGDAVVPPVADDRRRAMRALEEDLDRVLLALMQLGGLAYIETRVREARRALIIEGEKL